MRTECLNYKYSHDDTLPVGRLIANLGNKMQTCTQRYDRRPYGVGLLVAGFDVINFSSLLFFKTQRIFIIKRVFILGSRSTHLPNLSISKFL